jgi:hypothetical protein
MSGKTVDNLKLTKMFKKAVFSQIMREKRGKTKKICNSTVHHFCRQFLSRFLKMWPKFRPGWSWQHCLRTGEPELTGGGEENFGPQVRLCLQDSLVLPPKLTSVGPVVITHHVFQVIFFNRGTFFDLLCTLCNAASSAAPQIPLCRRMLVSNPELLRL